jgi:hypothetical protein
MKVNGVDSLLETLKDSSSHEEQTLLMNATRLLMVLCRFDEFREAKGGMMEVEPIIVSLAHDHALEFLRNMEPYPFCTNWQRRRRRVWI